VPHRRHCTCLHCTHRRCSRHRPSPRSWGYSSVNHPGFLGGSFV
jgi:hypothetical protein